MSKDPRLQHFCPLMDKHHESNHLSASFSYLASPEENFVLKLSKSVPHQDPPGTAQKLASTSTKEDEICVFAAERYYNVKLEDERPKESLEKNGRRVLKSVDRKIRSRPGTPSVCSESSGHSQAALVPNLMKNPSQKDQNKGKGRRCLASLCCSGSCADEKSVCVQKNQEQRGSAIVDGKKKLHTSITMAKTRRNSEVSMREEHYFAAKSHERDAKMAEDEDQDPRKSLDVFGSQKMNKEEDTVTMNLERKLSVFTWDAIPKAPTGQKKVKNEDADETRNSDCSSDLFEIENLSGSGQPIFTSQTSDGLPSETETSTELTTASEFEEKQTAEKGAEPPLMAEKGGAEEP